MVSAAALQRVSIWLCKDFWCRLFDVIDLDKDKFLSSSELRALIVGIRFEEINFDQDDAVDKVMKDFDKSGDDRIQFSEFMGGVEKWLEEAKRDKASSPDQFHEVCWLNNFDN